MRYMECWKTRISGIAA